MTGRRLASAVVALLVLAGTAGCDIPIGALRRGPPEGIDARAIRAATWAPDFRLEGTRGPFSLFDAVAHDSALLVFYRGHW
jgi:hypothetical protein